MRTNRPLARNDSAVWVALPGSDSDRKGSWLSSGVTELTLGRAARIKRWYSLDGHPQAA